jgi:hypothetical protein
MAYAALEKKLELDTTREKKPENKKIHLSGMLF